MTATIARRAFIAGLGGVVTAWPLATQAQQRQLPVVGYVSVASAATAPEREVAFRKVWAKPAIARGGT